MNTIVLAHIKIKLIINSLLYTSEDSVYNFGINGKNEIIVY